MDLDANRTAWFKSKREKAVDSFRANFERGSLVKVGLTSPGYMHAYAWQGGEEVLRRCSMVQEVQENELSELLGLYLYLHKKSVPKITERLKSTQETILKDRNHYIIVNEVDAMLLSSCVCVITPNLTRNVRPYALAENVVTRGDCRGKGYATECLHYARKVAQEANCYKRMLLTGAKEEATLSFYSNAGYNSGGKTAFVQ